MPGKYFAKKGNKRSGGGPFAMGSYGHGKNPITFKASPNKLFGSKKRKEKREQEELREEMRQDDLVRRRGGGPFAKKEKISAKMKEKIKDAKDENFEATNAALIKAGKIPMSRDEYEAGLS